MLAPMHEAGRRWRVREVTLGTLVAGAVLGDSCFRRQLSTLLEAEGGPVAQKEVLKNT